MYGQTCSSLSVLAVRTTLEHLYACVHAQVDVRMLTHTVHVQLHGTCIDSCALQVVTHVLCVYTKATCSRWHMGCATNGAYSMRTRAWTVSSRTYIKCTYSHTHYVRTMYVVIKKYVRCNLTHWHWLENFPRLHRLNISNLDKLYRS